VRRPCSYRAIKTDGVEEILLPAGSLPNRLLPLRALRCVECYSTADRDLVEGMMRHFERREPVELKERPRYVEGQKVEPGFRLHRQIVELYSAVGHNDREGQRTIIKDFSSFGFD